MSFLQICVNQALEACLFHSHIGYSTIMHRIQPIIQQTLHDIHRIIPCPQLNKTNQHGTLSPCECLMSIELSIDRSPPPPQHHQHLNIITVERLVKLMQTWTEFSRLKMLGTDKRTTSWLALQQGTLLAKTALTIASLKPQSIASQATYNFMVIEASSILGQTILNASIFTDFHVTTPL
jgi:hypothetical protein